MLKKRILVISWFYPPVNSSEGLVTYKLLKASKYEYDVFCQKGNASWSYGNKEKLPETQNVNSIYAKTKDLNEWIEEAVEYFNENKDKYDIVMTRSMPPESHMIGLRLKKIKPEITWIASFGDPIAENPYVKLTISYPSPHSRANCKSFKGIISPKRIIRNGMFKIRYRKQQKSILEKDLNLQNNVFKNSDYIIFNSEYQKNYMFRNCKQEIKDKGIVLNHSFDKELYPKTVEKNEKIKMTYVGHLDYLRTPHLLLEAISELKEEDENLADKICFEFYGNMGNEDKVLIIDDELTDIVKVKKPVSYLESLKIMKQSDWVFLIDANLTEVSDKNIFFAAKLADYMGSGSNIFGITMLDGISADILRNLNMILTSYSKEEIKNYLWLILNNNYTVKANEEYRKEFDSTEVAKRFDELISKIN